MPILVVFVYFITTNSSHKLGFIRNIHMTLFLKSIQFKHHFCFFLLFCQRIFKCFVCLFQVLDIFHSKTANTIDTWKCVFLQSESCFQFSHHLCRAGILDFICYVRLCFRSRLITLSDVNLDHTSPILNIFTCNEKQYFHACLYFFLPV